MPHDYHKHGTTGEKQKDGWRKFPGRHIIDINVVSLNVF